MTSTTRSRAASERGRRGREKPARARRVRRMVIQAKGVSDVNATQKIVPSLWFDRDAEEAVTFYVELFNGSPHRSAESRIVSIKRYEEGMEVPGANDMLGRVITAVFELNGQRFMALDGGPLFKFTEAVSFYVECEDQVEVDYFWTRLSAVRESEQCGWLKDKFGLSWQIVPRQMGELLSAPDKKKALAAMNAMLKMKKIVIADLQKAFDEA
jgi:predicted 3-demethylubiquinone-9 3-methyltransferase (glyoxalase superfamily)